MIGDICHIIGDICHIPVYVDIYDIIYISLSQISCKPSWKWQSFTELLNKYEGKLAALTALSVHKF